MHDPRVTDVADRGAGDRPSTAAATPARGANGTWLNFIAGAWVDGPRRLDVENPADGSVYAQVAVADTAQADAAMTAARAVVDSGALSDVRPAVRVRWLLDIAAHLRSMSEEAAAVLCRENGKSLSDARDEVAEAARYFEYYAGMADKIEGTSVPLGRDYADWTVREPHGVSVQIVPWNFPVSICARSLAPALAAGNAVVVKSPEVSPLAMTTLALACQRAGLPDGAVSLLCGPGRQVGAYLVGHPLTDHIVFTGSVATGQAILRTAAERATPSVMELGGKSAAVVFPDADLDQLLDSVRSGIFFNAGQVCSAMSRLIVHASIAEDVIARVAALAENLEPGDGMNDPALTPLVSGAQLEAVEAICRRAVAEGATLVTGGFAFDRPGFFMRPTVFRDVAPDMEIVREEVFGPVIVVQTFTDEAEAWALANGTDYGLVAGVFTRDLSRALRGTRRLRAGQVFVNEWFAGGIETPFGGIGLSGFGREKGQEGLLGYVRTKNIAVRVDGA